MEKIKLEFNYRICTGRERGNGHKGEETIRNWQGSLRCSMQNERNFNSITKK